MNMDFLNKVVKAAPDHIILDMLIEALTRLKDTPTRENKEYEAFLGQEQLRRFLSETLGAEALENEHKKMHSILQQLKNIDKQ